MRGRTTPFQTRLEISEYAAANWDDPQIATALGCSVWTVRKWRRRWRKLGHAGFTSQMGRPVAGPMSTFPQSLKETILHLRRLHPGWGPATLLATLKTDSFWRDQSLPSRAAVARLLKQAGLTRRYQPHHDLSQPSRVSLNTPHQEWQMDAASASCACKGWARLV
jgi:transposase